MAAADRHERDPQPAPIATPPRYARATRRHHDRHRRPQGPRVRDSRGRDPYGPARRAEDSAGAGAGRGHVPVPARPDRGGNRANAWPGTWNREIPVVTGVETATADTGGGGGMT